MSNITITNIDNSNVILRDAEFEDSLIEDPGAADTYVDGTIMARLTANNKLVPFDPVGAGGAEIPNRILTYDIDLAGGADVPARTAISGYFRREKLIIDGGGTVTQAIVDQLRDADLVAVSVKELNIQDNQ